MPSDISSRALRQKKTVKLPRIVVPELGAGSLVATTSGANFWLATGLTEAYPVQSDGRTLFAYPRLFIVAVKAAA
jgi:hypothetical protein